MICESLIIIYYIYSKRKLLECAMDERLIILQPGAELLIFGNNSRVNKKCPK